MEKLPCRPMTVPLQKRARKRSDQSFPLIYMSMKLVMALAETHSLQLPQTNRPILKSLILLKIPNYEKNTFQVSKCNNFG